VLLLLDFSPQLLLDQAALLLQLLLHVQQVANVPALFRKLLLLRRLLLEQLSDGVFAALEHFLELAMLGKAILTFSFCRSSY
jgi:hypothetical protein